MAKQVMDIKPGIGMTLSQSNEHLRVAVNGAFTSRFSYNVDPTRDKLNFEIKNGEVVPVDKHISIPRQYYGSVASKTQTKRCLKRVKNQIVEL